MGLKLAPVEAGIRVEHDALGEIRSAGGGADCIEGFLALQGLVAVDDVDAREPVREAVPALLGTDAHATRDSAADPGLLRVMVVVRATPTFCARSWPLHLGASRRGACPAAGIWRVALEC